MVKQIVNIVEFQTLYNILSEVSDLVSFDILNFESINDFLINIDNNENKNLTIILKSLNKDLFKCKNIEKKNIIIIDKFPITLEKLIDKINIQLIKQKYDFQSKLTLKNYLVNLNSRIISKNKTELKLTEKEVDILVFFKHVFLSCRWHRHDSDILPTHVDILSFFKHIELLCRWHRHKL